MGHCVVASCRRSSSIVMWHLTAAYFASGDNLSVRAHYISGACSCHRLTPHEQPTKFSDTVGRRASILCDGSTRMFKLRGRIARRLPRVFHFQRNLDRHLFLQTTHLAHAIRSSRPISTRCQICVAAEAISTHSTEPTVRADLLATLAIVGNWTNGIVVSPDIFSCTKQSKSDFTRRL